MSSIKLEPSWLQRLEREFDKDYMRQLKDFLQTERAAGKSILPPPDLWFNALNSTPFDQVKVVIIGQDPYHGPGQAHGLCFSVLPGVSFPPSLRNIYKELCDDLGIRTPRSGCLSGWAQQGVLLLNATLTVEMHQAGSHQNKGWELFTDFIIDSLNTGRDGLVFVLWGSFAHRKGARIDENRHLVIRAPHPSPLSAHRGFFGSKPFSQVNQWLRQRGDTPIDWARTS